MNLLLIVKHVMPICQLKPDKALKRMGLYALLCIVVVLNASAVSGKNHINVELFEDTKKLDEPIDAYQTNNKLVQNPGYPAF